jgi:hypothetical protein
MKRFTVSVSKEFKEKLDKFPEINWPEVMKQGIIKRLELLEKLHSRGEL